MPTKVSLNFSMPALKSMQELPSSLGSGACRSTEGFKEIFEDWNAVSGTLSGTHVAPPLVV